MPASKPSENLVELAKEVHDLRKEVVRLRDLEEIRRLVLDFAYAIDRADFAAASRMYEHSTFEIWGRVITGRDEVREFLESTVRLYEDGTPKTLHATGSIVVDLDPSGVTATATSCTVVFQAVEGFPLQPIAHTRYIERFEKAEGGWGRTRHIHERLLAGDASHHVIGRA